MSNPFSNFKKGAALSVAESDNIDEIIQIEPELFADISGGASTLQCGMDPIQPPAIGEDGDPI